MPGDKLSTLAHRSDTTEVHVRHIDTFIGLWIEDAASETTYELVGPAHEVLDLLLQATRQITERGGVA